MEIEQIAKIETDFPTKFGIPRQSGLVRRLRGRIVFEEAYRSREALRGLEEYSHLWLLWGFSGTKCRRWSPTVRPPRLGGNTRVGVFATRSPFRPNAIGISCVELERIVVEKGWGPVIYVRGIDMMDQTPIYDIKPYLSYADSHPEASEGFAGCVGDYRLEVMLPEELCGRIPEDRLEECLELLSHDPRPSYHHDPERIYGMEYAGMEITFRIRESRLEVLNIVRPEEIGKREQNNNYADVGGNEGMEEV